MKPQELRIGNWVKTCIPNSRVMIPTLEAEVQGVTIFGECQFLHTPHVQGFGMPAKHLMGIPLTEEWFEKFGFSKPYSPEYNILSYQINNHLLRLNTFENWHNDSEACFWLANYHGRKGFKLKYVHQLQNLYFALTGEELTIK